jgi:hypothetical protein
MTKHFFRYILLMLLTFGVAPQGFAATVAHASVGHEKVTVGTYDVSSMSENEQEWFLTFLRGNFFADGWEQISSDILSSTFAREREQQKDRLVELGFKIGSEWSKGNDKRKINTSMLREWGSVLKSAAKDTPHLLAEVLQRIDKEVDELLN